MNQFPIFVMNFGPCKLPYQKALATVSKCAHKEGIESGPSNADENQMRWNTRSLPTQRSGQCLKDIYSALWIVPLAMNFRHHCSNPPT
jgi:hypothetical protein